MSLRRLLEEEIAQHDFPPHIRNHELSVDETWIADQIMRLRLLRHGVEVQSLGWYARRDNRRPQIARLYKKIAHLEPQIPAK